jgi:polyisoprenoid-binding protein YceI
MKQKPLSRLSLAAALIALAIAARAATTIAVAPAGSLRLEGDSTLHKWESTATAAVINFTFADGAPTSLYDAIIASKATGAELKVAVASLKSGESGLDKNMRKAMSADKYPDVVFRMNRYELMKDPTLAKVDGDLTIAGATRPVTIDMEARQTPEGVGLKGVYTLKMSDFGIKPPTLMLGAIKVSDRVAVRFDLTLPQPKETRP